MHLPVCRLSGHSADVVKGRISPDLHSVSTCSADKSLCVWDTFTGAALRLFEHHKGEVSDLSYHGSGNGVLSSCMDGLIRLFDLRSSSGSPAMMIPHTTQHAEFPEELACLTVGRSANSPILVSGSSMGYLNFYDMRKGDLMVSSFAHYNSIMSLETSPNDTMVASASLDGTIRVFSASKGDCLMTVDEAISRAAPCVYAGFTSDCEGLVGLFLDSTGRRWDMHDRIHPKQVITGPKISNSTKTFAKIDDIGGVAIPSEDGTIHFINVYSGKQVQKPTKAHADDVLSVDYRDGVMISTGAGEDSSAVLWIRVDEEGARTRAQRDYSMSYSLVLPQIEGLI